MTADSIATLTRNPPAEFRGSLSSQIPGISELAALSGPDRAYLLEGRLIPVLAHELRGPLTTLATSSELLLEDLQTLEPEQIRKMVSSIHRSALWMQGLVENLLCAATLSEGEFKIRPQPSRLIDVISEVRPIVQPMLAQRRQVLRTSSRGVTREVAADAQRIGQVLVNLISNASKFAPPGTVVDVTVATRGASRRVSVSDRGPGVPAEAMRKLFEPYQQLAPACYPNPGIGLGLSIVRSIVDAHGGQLGVTNRRGGGSIFWFELAVLAGTTTPLPQVSDCATRIRSVSTERRRQTV